ncbi:hypothetical protein M427DRAFT_502606 [Gonapodya prolifera JEL478]|uniref:Uncharacterized protein n=1 Tax=Gonapodya prolifera (strain JEL478) TaxID=1344416 RepID=A0A139A699_GONPJ|nr:hypothetical protein M427DRAFT_502606 [Gonapodya prolifera JEL478]|eukprot:KXS12326.1 hypothetical protein M427DRAFT_502606 [Gonapodya prolifera JEL478]
MWLVTRSGTEIVMPSYHSSTTSHRRYASVLYSRVAMYASPSDGAQRLKCSNEVNTPNNRNITHNFAPSKKHPNARQKIVSRRNSSHLVSEAGAGPLPRRFVILAPAFEKPRRDRMPKFLLEKRRRSTQRGCQLAIMRPKRLERWFQRKIRIKDGGNSKKFSPSSTGIAVTIRSRSGRIVSIEPADDGLFAQYHNDARALPQNESVAAPASPSKWRKRKR